MTEKEAKNLMTSLSIFITRSGLDMIDEVKLAKRLFNKLENK